MWLVAVAARHLRLGGLDHLAAVRRHRRRDLQAGELAHLRACEAVHRVGRHLECELAAVIDSILEHVGVLPFGLLRFHVGLRLLARREQLLEHLREDPLARVRLDEDVAGGRLGVRVGREAGDVLRPLDEGRVAQVVRHHDRRVQRREVERRHRLAVEALLGLDDGGAFELVALLRLPRRRRDEEPLLAALAVELRHDLDLLAAREEVRERHAGDARHLGVVDDAHQLREKPGVEGGARGEEECVRRSV